MIRYAAVVRSLIFGTVVLASVSELSCSRDTSYLPIEYSVGEGEPVLGAKVSFHVTPEFSRQDTRDLFAALQTEDLRSVLDSVACGEDVPEFRFTVSLWRQAPMNVRHIEVREAPWLEGGRRNECLVGGMKFFVMKTIEGIENRRKVETSVKSVSAAPASTTGYAVKGISCDCVARSNGLPSVRYEHWPIP